MDAPRERPTDMVLTWLAEHGHEYVGQWVALAEGQVVAAGTERGVVAAAAQARGGRVVLVEVAGTDGGPRGLFR